MTKNQNKNDGNKQLKNVLDEQNEPCLKAIHKKLRNINKKITQINELGSKGNLKPEQIQKVNKKEKFLEEKAKYEEFLIFYKEIITENTQMYKAFQYKQLTNLAEAIAIANFSSHHIEYQNQHLSHLLQIITTPSSPHLTVQKRTNQLYQTFQSFAENQKLKQWIGKNIEMNSQKHLENVPHPNKQKQQSPKKQNQLIPEKKKEPQVVQQIKGQKLSSDLVEQKCTEQNEVKAEVVEPKIEQEKKERQHRKYPKKEFKDHEKRKYKPKYINKKQDNNEGAEQREENEEEQAIIRQFKREEVKRLYEDGFIVVGKPKIKAKNGQKDYHEHQHGKKYHYHKQNY